MEKVAIAEKTIEKESKGHFNWPILLSILISIGTGILISIGTGILIIQ